MKENKFTFNQWIQIVRKGFYYENGYSHIVDWKKIFLLLNFLSVFAISQNGIQFSKPTQVSGVAPVVITNNTVVSMPQSSSVTDGYLSATDWNLFNSGAGAWKTTGNATASNTTFIGCTDNRSLIIKTNNTPYAKFDSVGVFRLYNSTASPTIGGSMYYDDALNGLTVVVRNGTDGFTVRSANGLIRAGINTFTSGIFSDGVYLGTWSNDNIYFGTNLDAALQGFKISKTNGNVTFNPSVGTNTSCVVRVNSLGLTNMIECTTASEATKVFVVSNTGIATATGYSLSAGSMTVGAKVINTTAGDAATINSPTGRFRKDNTGSSFVLTNSQITANSIILLTLVSTGITTGNQLSVQAGSGTATITFETGGVAAAPSANCDVNFYVIN